MLSARAFTRVQSIKVCARSAALARSWAFSGSVGRLVIVWLVVSSQGGAPGVTRTRGQRFRKPLLYPSELQGPRWHGAAARRSRPLRPTPMARPTKVLDRGALRKPEIVSTPGQFRCAGPEAAGLRPG